MGLGAGSDGIESRFAAYVEALTGALGHADRAAPFQSYCAGLLLPGERKSVEPMAARVEPQRVQAAHQSCQISLKRFCLKLCESSLIVAASSGRVAATRRHVHTSRA